MKVHIKVLYFHCKKSPWCELWTTPYVLYFRISGQLCFLTKRNTHSRFTTAWSVRLNAHRPEYWSTFVSMLTPSVNMGRSTRLIKYLFSYYFMHQSHEFFYYICFAWSNYFHYFSWKMSDASQTIILCSDTICCRSLK